VVGLLVERIEIRPGRAAKPSDRVTIIPRGAVVDEATVAAPPPSAA
jgi:hypothetical protein